MFNATDYLHPKFWPSWLGLAFLRVLSWLPLPVLAFLGKLVGAIVYRCMSKRREITLVNLATCFPELDEQQRIRIAKQCFELIAFTACSIGVNWWASPKRLARLVSYEGREHYDKLVDNTQNIVMLAPHSIALEMGALLLSKERPMITMYQQSKHPMMDAYIKDRRGRFKGLLVERKAPLRNLLRLIKQGNPFYYLPDQDAGKKGVFVPFFGQEASTFPMLSKFSKLGKAAVLPVYTHILPSGRGWHVVIGEPVNNFPTDDEIADTAKMNQIIEQMIRSGPQQYFWVHKRFKTQQSGEFYST